MSWRRLRSLLVPLLAVVLMLTSILPASAAPVRPSSDEAISLLTSYGMVLGDENGNLNLTKPITRAEAATIFVRAMGQEGSVKLLGNLSSFPDTNGHWAAAYVTVAYRLGLMKGRDTGLFDPGAEITNAEVLTVLLRIVKREPAGIWSPFTVMETADELGLVTFPNPGAVANQRAIRGDIFQSLAWTITTVPLAEQGGKTALAAYVDKSAPKLTVEAVPASTGTASIRVSGTAKGAAYVQVNGNKVNLAGEAFSTDVALSFGSNSISVEAYDWAGNKDSKSFTVARAGEAARIVVTGEVAVKAGESGTVNVKAYDAQGTEIPTSLLKATVSNNMGTFDTATATFKAGTKAGKGAITFTSGTATATANVEVLGVATEAYSLSITDGVMVTQGKSTQVTVKILDRNGQLVTWDSGRSVKLVSSNTTALWITSGESAVTERGVATFTVGALQEGLVGLSATSSGLSSASGSVQVASSTRVVLTPSAASSTADGTTPVTVRATLQDENGAAVVNSGADIIIDLSSNGATTANLSSRTVTIRSGYSNSAGFDGSVIPGFDNETINITGSVRSGRSYTVVSTRISFVKREVGTPSRLELLGGGNYAPGQPATYSVVVRDSQGNLVSTGSFAFQVQVSTNNPDTSATCTTPVTPVAGMPPCLTVKLGTTSYNPVAAATGSVVGRTFMGNATITVNYYRSGTITVKLLPANGSGGGYDSATGSFGVAYSSAGLAMGERAATWAGTPAKIGATVDLPRLNLTEQPAGVLPADGSSQARIKLQVLDINNGKLPAFGTAKLEKLGSTIATSPLVTSGNVTNGTIEFPVVATTNVDTDEYKLTYWPNPSDTSVFYTETIKISTNKTVLTTPYILAISGQSGIVNRVTASDTYMEVRLPNYGSSVYGVVRVYQSNGTLVHTSQVIQLNGGPYVRVPKDRLASGTSYYVTINNGFGETGASDRYPASPATVAVETTRMVNITQVRYTAFNVAPAVPTLTVYAGVLSSGVIDPSRLSFSYPMANGTTGTAPIGAITCTPSNGSFTCPNASLPAAAAGPITLVASEGWYRNDADGTVAQTENTPADNMVIGGTGNLLYGVASFGTDAQGHATARITLYGANLASGTIYSQYLTANGTLAVGLTNQAFAAGSGNAVTFDLPNFNQTPYPQDESNSVAAKLKAMTGPITLQGAMGWFRNSSEYGAATVAIPLYRATTITSVRYVPAVPDADPSNPPVTPAKLVINGSGLLGTFKPENLAITNRADTSVVALSVGQAVSKQEDTVIEIDLTSGQASTIAANLGNLFLTSADPGTGNFWLQADTGWYAAGLARQTYLIGGN
ncbi:MAG TPA: S-layer homology domain-containing protein [Symbiobacteriaceae bacterium]|nr:S-layer homology domain-containing protein [Symbiobacteriaceae bacterium]